MQKCPVSRWVHGLGLRKEFWTEDTRFTGVLHEDADHRHGGLSVERKRMYRVSGTMTFMEWAEGKNPRWMLKSCQRGWKKSGEGGTTGAKEGRNFKDRFCTWSKPHTCQQGKGQEGNHLVCSLSGPGHSMSVERWLQKPCLKGRRQRREAVQAVSEISGVLGEKAAEKLQVERGPGLETLSLKNCREISAFIC